VATYTVHLRLIAKLVWDFLFVIELFSLGAFVLSHECAGQTDIGMTAIVHCYNAGNPFRALSLT